MSDFNAVLNQRVRNILSIVDAIPRRVTTGCVVKVPTSVIFGDTEPGRYPEFMYGVVGEERDYCYSTTAMAFQVHYCSGDIPVFPMIQLHLDYPVFENDMIIMRFPEQNASLDDYNIDRLFHKVNGAWKRRATK